MNWLDYILIAFLAMCAISSARRGFVREAIGLVAAVLALVLGMWFYGTAALLVEPIVGPGRAASLLGFLLVVAVVLTAGAAVGWIVRRFIHAIGLSIFDRLLGAAFGAVRGALIATTVLTAYMAFGPHAAGEKATNAPAAVVHSEIAPWLLEGSRLFVSIAPMELKSGFREQYEKVKAASLQSVRDGVQGGMAGRAGAGDSGKK